MSPILTDILGAGGIGIAAISFYGWGRIARRIAGLPAGTWSVSIALGLAAAIFLGGLLNLSRLAYPWALDGLLVLGLAFALDACRRDGWRQTEEAFWPSQRGERLYVAIWYGLVLAIMGFTIATQLTPRVFNLSDDFQKYFAHAVRMVQTGTLAGGSLDALGSETLGAQAFLQGFVVGHFPIYFINAADGVFCFCLCLLLAGGVALHRPAIGFAALLGVLGVFFIHPQYVNVSSLYSTAALMMGLTLVTGDPRETSPATARSAIGPALFYAAIISLKPTGVLYLGALFVLSTLLGVWAQKDWRIAVKRAFWIALWSAIFLVPWVALYVPRYITAFQHPLAPPTTPIPDVDDAANFFSSATATYDGSHLAYTAIAIGLTLYVVLAISRKLPKALVGQRPPLLEFAAACAAAVFAYLLSNLAGPLIVEADGALRYSIPVLIGVMPVALGLGALYADDAATFPALRRGSLLAIGCTVVMIALFALPALHRIDSLFVHGSQLAFLRTAAPQPLANLKNYEDTALHGGLADEIKYFQEKIPAGEPILAWIATPFYLDFRRNPIIDANDSGFGTGWAQFPAVDYILWQHIGYGITPPQNYLGTIRAFGRRLGFVLARAYDFRRHLEGLVPQSTIVADEDGVAILRLDNPPGR